VTSEEIVESGGKTHLLSRDATLVLVYLLLNSIPIGYMNVVPQVYLIQIGFPAGTVSIIYATSAIANTIGLTPFGILADRFGRKKFLIVGSAVPAISYVIFGLSLNPYWLIIASAIGGVGLAGGIAVAMSGPALLPVVAETASNENRTKMFGAVQAIWTIALTIGAFLSFLPDFLKSNLGTGVFLSHSISYYTMAILIAVSIVPILFIREDRAQRSSTINSRGRDQVFGGWTSWARSKFGFNSARAIKRFSVVYFLSGLGLGVSVQLVATWYALSYGTSEGTTGFWIAIAELVSASSILFIPPLVKKWGTLRSSVITGLISAVFLGAMPLSNFFLLAAILFIARSLFINISWPILQSYIMGVVDEGERAAATGIATTAWGIANSIGTLLGGILLASPALRALPFGIALVGYGSSALLLGYLFRGIKPPEEGESSVPV
jgi:MFS family permease